MSAARAGTLAYGPIGDLVRAERFRSLVRL